MPRKKLNEAERIERERERKREWKRRNQSKQSVKNNNIVYIRKRREDPEYRANENMKRRLKAEDKEANERLKEQKRQWKKRNQSKESIKLSNMLYMRKRRSDPVYRANENIKRRQRKTAVEEIKYDQKLYDSLETQESEIYKTILVGDFKVSFANNE